MHAHISMQSLLLVALVFTAVSAKYVPVPAPYSDRCILEHGQNAYNPNHQYDVPWFTVNLDAPAKQRWVPIATRYKEQIAELVDTIKELITPIFPSALNWTDIIFGDLDKKLPQPYRDEITGIAEATGIPVGEVTLYNVFYEVFTVCTSVIAQDPTGKLYHARNLDFGLFLGWNATSHNWALTEKLRKMIVNINWVKDGRLVFKSNNFAGFVGVYNGMKQNGFTLTANERFSAEGGYLGILRWLLGLEPNGQWMTWHARQTMINASNYEEAYKKLSTEAILSPVYYILGGTKKDEGVVITRSLEKTVSVTRMNSSQDNGWYVLQTNYDPGTEPFFLDDRRTPGRHCMQVMGSQNVSFQGIYNVLSSKTNLNKLTTYTVLMQVDSGQFETHLQDCPNPCWPF